MDKEMLDRIGKMVDAIFKEKEKRDKAFTEKYCPWLKHKCTSRCVCFVPSQMEVAPYIGILTTTSPRCKRLEKE